MTTAIIGAGLAGLTAGYMLAKARQEVVVFEKSRGLTGRAATRRYTVAEGQVYVDHGAQYFKGDSPTLARLALETLPRDTITDVARPVWFFNGTGEINAGAPESKPAPKWTYREGIATLGKLITAEVGLRVVTQTKVGALHRKLDGGFGLIDTEGSSLGGFSTVVIALPAPQAADLIAVSQIPQDARVVLESNLRTATYRRCITAILGYSRQLPAKPYYALVNVDRGHPISWVGFEHEKPGHAPAGVSVLVVQMAGPYSLEHWDDDKEALLRDVAARSGALLGDNLSDYTFSDVQKWRYALPEKLASPTTLHGVVPGLWFAGDYLAGPRLHLAAESGANAARAILAQ